MSDPFAYKRDAKLQARLATEIQKLLKLPGNSECADCGATRTVRFCSVTLGVFLCNRCYGIHRNVGAHITRTKCCNGLDTWSTAEVEALRAMGNRRANALFEATAPADVARATASSTDRETERWIRDKYERRRYAAAPAAVSSAPAHAAAVAAAPAAAAPAFEPPSNWAAFETGLPSAPAASAVPAAAAQGLSQPTCPTCPTCPAGTAPGGFMSNMRPGVYVEGRQGIYVEGVFYVAAGGVSGGSEAPTGPAGGSSSCLLD